MQSLTWHVLLIFLHNPPLHRLSTEIEQKRNILNVFNLLSQGREVEKKLRRFPTSALCIFGKPRTLFVSSTGKVKLTFSCCHSRALAFSARCLFALVNPVLLLHPRLTAVETEHERNKSSVFTEEVRRQCSNFSWRACSAGTYPEGNSLWHIHFFSIQNTNKSAN